MALREFHIMSDLHFETPKAGPSYEEFEIRPQCTWLALLGDIGNVLDPRFFKFLDKQLLQFEVVFFLLGNLEPHGLSFHKAVATLHAYEEDITRRAYVENVDFGQFVFLERRRYDCSRYLTVLGCTLFSNIKTEERESIGNFISDFSKIKDWTVESHKAAHKRDLNWLNSAVADITLHEPERSIIIFTHHSPTTLEAANDPRHTQSLTQVRSAFMTDLSEQYCWTCPRVKLWAFGHTHYNCDFIDPQTGKHVLANQRGWQNAGGKTFDAKKVATVIADTPQIPKLLEELEKQEKEEENRAKKKRCVVSWPNCECLGPPEA